MNVLSAPILLDVTIRDGSNLINHQWKPKQVAAIARGLSNAGIQWTEISHGNGLGGKLMGLPAFVSDEELLQAAREAAPKLNFSVFILASDLSAALLPSFVDFFDLGRIGVSIDCVSSAEKILQKLKRFKKQAFVQLVRSHARPPEFVAEQAKLAQNSGADGVYLVDTFGSMTPQDVTIYIQAIKASSSIPVGFHGHNMTGMAIPNTWAAWKAGATWLDASLLGVGRGAGNTNLEALTALLQSEGVVPNLSIEALSQTTQQEILPIFVFPPQTSLLDLEMARERLDHPSPVFLELMANYLGLSFDSFLREVHCKMGANSQLSDQHLQQVAEAHGKDFKQLTDQLKGA